MNQWTFFLGGTIGLLLLWNVWLTLVVLRLRKNSHKDYVHSDLMRY